MKKIIGFFGGDSQVGTTMIAQSLAELLTERGKTVLFILGSGKYGKEFLGLDYKHSIDDLKASVRSGKVTEEELSLNINEYKGLYFIASVRNPLSAKYFPENTFEIMLQSVSEDFDYIIIDGGDDANLGLTISALNISDFRYFVTTQEMKSVFRMKLFEENILSPLKFCGKLIVNKYLADPALFLKQEIAGLVHFPAEEIITLPYMEYGWQAEMEGKTLLHFAKYAKAAEQLAEEFEPTEEGHSRGKRILFRRVSQ